jgi:acyl-CoA synthetase (AMP-forming)/AMP-acid ligase II
VNIAMLLEMVADGAGDRVVVGGRENGLTAAALLARTRRAAYLFQGSGAERVALIDVNSDAVPVALFGAALAGLPFSPVSYRLSDDQLDAIVRRLAPALVVAGPDAIARVGAIDQVTVVPRDEFLAVTEHGESGGELPFVDPDDIAVLLFTSGTTGEPKAALLRHRHLTSYVLGSVDYLAAGEDEAQLVTMPPYHVAGVASVLSSLYRGRRIVYQASFDPGGWVRAVQDEGVTHAMVVPTMLARILTSMAERGVNVSSLRHLSYGGGRMPLELVEQAMTAWPDVDFVNAYGLTETSSTISVLTPEDHRSAFASDDPTVRRRLTSVGQPLPTVEVEIRDGDGVLPPGRRGEIYVRGDQVAGEYVGHNALTADGWLPTNDAGYLDDEGFLFLEGRLDDVIVRGGENLSPGEIEDALRSCPGVADAAVVGVPDPEWGEAVAAVIVRDDGSVVSEDDVKQWVRNRLRSTKTPQLFTFRSEMPYSDTGKLLRRVLREELASSSK